MSKAPSVRKKSAGRKTVRKWSSRVMQTSHALDLESKVFKSGSADKIARSLKRSAERSQRRKGTPFQSAMSRLNFYVNRGGKNLSVRKKTMLETTKNKLRKLFGRPVKNNK